jgi:hypothetical protein
MDIYWNTNKPNSIWLVVRPDLHAPEIDAYDEIHPSQVIKWNIEIWEKITYWL